MHKIADVEIAKNIMDANDRLAHKNLHLLEDHDIFCIDFVGAIGSGKTALIEDLIDNLDAKIGVLAGDGLLNYAYEVASNALTKENYEYTRHGLGTI